MDYLFAGGIVSLIAILFLLFVAILWIIFPFIVMAGMDKVSKQLLKTHHTLEVRLFETGNDDPEILGASRANSRDQ